MSSMSSHLLRTAAPPLWHRHIKHFLSPPITTTTVHRRQSHSKPPQGLRLPRHSDTAETGKGFGGDAYSFTAAKEKEKEKEKENKRRSRNESKREAREAVRWGMDLASFSTPQIKRILKVASLEPEVFEALMVVKRLGPDVREGKRRQFNLIGKLLRDADAQPELLGALIQATKDGDQSRFQALAGSVELVDEAEEEFHESESEPEPEDDGEHLVLASKWFDGLINKDIQISNEVYSVDNVEFDRQELRRLVRRVHSVQHRLNSNEEETSAALETAKKPLNKFLCSLAKKCLSMSNAENVMM